VQKSVHSKEQEVLQHLLLHLWQERGFSQRQLAERLEKPAFFIYWVEKGNVMLDMPQLRQVSHALGLTLRELVDRYEAALEQKL